MKRVRETIVERLLHLSASISALATILIFAFMFLLGLPLLSGGRFLSVLTKPWAPHLGLFGVYPMIVGTVVISLLGMAFAFPLSMGCAVLISVTGGRGTSRLMRRTVEAMTGVPTVVYGFVGIFLLVPVVRRVFAVGSGMCVLSASVMLALLVSPTMILFFSDSFDSVPRPYGHAVRALGGTKIQSFLHVLLPCSGRGIAAGFLLALGRALGDTLIALMIAGNAVQVPGSILDSARTLTSHIALVIAADSESPEFRAIFACGVSLYLITTVLVLILRARAPRHGGRTR